MLLLFAYLALAIVVSFLCSIAEAVLLSVRPAYVTALERSGAPGASALSNLRANLDRPLAAILTLNTISHTVGAAGVGAQAAIVFGNQYLGVVSAVLTLLILVFSEIIPKTLGATYWKSLAPVTGVTLMWITKVMHPIITMSEWLTRRLSRGGASAFTFSRDEMEAMADIGAEEGVLEEREREIVANLMSLDNISIRTIMTPRSVLFSAPRTMTVAAYFEAHAEEPFSRIAIYRDNPDDVDAYVLKAEIFAAQAKDEHERRLEEFARPFPVIPDVVTVFRAFEQLVRDSAHAALVVNEYGDLQGLVTLEDIIETLVGLEITDELDTVEDMQVLARRRMKRRTLESGSDK
ncbi:MAG: HlyC/CorC family transporter [Marinicaulis sp.]|nr:hemolysin family protein [Marinicaulis sp.]NNL89577.1 HlyC/CorC family transporter [Marinicaulis sp.]